MATQSVVERALERDHWAAADLKAVQDRALETLLQHAATRVPFYRNLWQQRRREGDNRPWERLENWPILDKEAVRADPKAFLSDDRPRLMFSTSTSGTTGTPLRLWQSRRSLVTWYGVMEARWRKWYGVSRYDRWAILGGQLVAPVRQKQPPYWVWNAALRQLYLSTYHLAPDTILDYAKALERHRVSYIWGYSSAVHLLAKGLLDLKRKLAMKVVITNAEPLYDFQRQAISEAFDCPVRETYGSSEMVAAASECEHGSLHLWPMVGVAEVVDDGGNAVYETSGDLICTGLINPDMPLIRYRIADRGCLADPSQLCSCGRSLPILRYVDGRCDDIVYGPEGRFIGRLDPVFKQDLPIHEAQIIQRERTLIVVRYVPTERFGTAHASTIVRRIKERLGEVTVQLERVERIPRTATGKFRAVICEVGRSHHAG
jgi:phenylacetate-CoA ligase